MGLVHDAELRSIAAFFNYNAKDAWAGTHDDFGSGRVFRGELAPDTGKLCVGRPALADDGSVPSRIIVLVVERTSAGLDCRYGQNSPGLKSRRAWWKQTERLGQSYRIWPRRSH